MGNYRIFTSLWFLVALIFLLLNDFVFKEIYGNWITGKLSDFAGLFVFALFWMAFFPRHRVNLLWGIALLFTIWKSSVSQPFIDSWNQLGLMNIHRTIDYTDLIALAILPIAYYYDLKINEVKTLRINPIVPIVLSAFAFIATSYRTNVGVDRSYTFEFPKDTLSYKLNNIDSLNFGHDIIFSQKNPDTVEFSMPTSQPFRRFELKVAVTEIDSTSTVLKLISGEYSSPKEKWDKEKLIAEFEARVIAKIRDSL